MKDAVTGGSIERKLNMIQIRRSCNSHTILSKIETEGCNPRHRWGLTIPSRLDANL